MFLSIFKVILLSFVLIGCSVHLPPSPSYEALSDTLGTLDSNISKIQREKLSKDIYQKTYALSKTFRLTSPPQYHNFLVTIGAREKGLCYDWSDALYRHLKSQNYASFDFHLMAANIGEYWHEHNVLLVVGKGKAIDEGIIIDPWRNSGRLFFAKVKEDTKYQWIHRPKRCKTIGANKPYL